MGQLEVWKILDQIILELKQHQISIPEYVINDMKSAKILVKTSRTTPTSPEDIQNIERYLTNVESYAISESEKHLGSRKANELLKQLYDAGKTPSKQKEDETDRFVLGGPRRANWIRIRPSEEMKVHDVELLAETSNLEHMTQDDGSLILKGSPQQLNDFVRKMTAKYGAKPRKTLSEQKETAKRTE